MSKYKISSKMISSILATVMIVFALSIPVFVSAVSQNNQGQVSDIKNKIGNIDQKIKDSQKRLDEIAKQKSTKQNSLDILMDEVDELEKQISQYQDKISILNKSVNDLNTKIELTETQIQVQKKEIEETKEKLSDRLRAMYMAGETSSVELILTSNSFESFLTRLELVKSISEHDEQLIEGFQKKVNELKDTEKELRDSKIKVEADKEKEVKARDELQPKKDLRDYKASNLNKEITKLKESNKLEKKHKLKLLEQRQAFEAQIDNLLNGNISTGSGSGSLMWPVPISGTYITSYFGPRTLYGKPNNHKGIDISHARAGHKTGPFTIGIVAAADGVVKISRGGYNGGYGNYIVIDHGNGLSTRYGHLYTRHVSVGQHVKQGQTIGIMGTTGNSTGAHLHFEVRINNVAKNPLAGYVSKP